MFLQDQEVQKSLIDIYFTSFKTFFYFYYYPKHGNMIKYCSQTVGLLQVISSILQYIGSHSEIPEPRDWEEAGNLLEVQPQVSLSLAMGRIPLGWSDSAQTRRACEKVKGRGLPGLAQLNTAACLKNIW